MDGTLIALIVVGVIALIGTGLRRMGSKHGGSSGAASFLGELDHMLNPQRPTIEDIRAAKEDDGERDDEGDRPQVPKG